jgi:hypothetical protein
MYCQPSLESIVRQFILVQNFKMETTTRKANNNSGALIYGLGFIGALIYYIQIATSFWIGVIGFFKAVFWPAFLVYYLLEFLKK